MEEANRFLRQSYIGEFNRKFAVAAAESGTAFLPAPGRDLERVFAIQHERVVNRDNTVQVENRVLQIEKTPLAGDAGGLPGDGLRTPGRDAAYWLWPARGGGSTRQRGSRWCPSGEPGGEGGGTGLGR